MRSIKPRRQLFAVFFKCPPREFLSKQIATTFNEEHLPTPRPQARNGWATWCHTAIRKMLYRELYAGTVIWNRSKFVPVPGTNRRVRRMRPQSEWRIVQREELRIIEQDLWEQVKRRLNAFKELYHSRVQPGLLPRSETTKFLFSGLLKWGRCGGNLAIVASGRKDQYENMDVPNTGIVGLVPTICLNGKSGLKNVFSQTCRQRF